MKNFLCNTKKNFLEQRGQVAVIVALIIISLLGMTALVIDVGSLYQKKGFFQTVADAAALAGAQELPESPEGAFASAVDYADRNNVDITYIYDGWDYSSEEIEISSTYSPDDTITVTLANREAPLYFAKIFGKDTVPISAGAKAMAGSPVELYYAVPWAAVIPDGENWESWLERVAGMDMVIERYSEDFYVWGDEEHNPNVEWGHWKDVYGEWIKNGYPGPLSAGDSIFIKEIDDVKVLNETVSATGDRLGGWNNLDTFEYLTYNDYGVIKLARNDTQFVIIPLIYNNPVPPLQETEIIAFAPFIILDQKDHGSKAKIIGRFIHQALIVSESEEIGPAREVGFKVIRLVE
jgi:hypothetical protein